MIFVPLYQICTGMTHILRYFVFFVCEIKRQKIPANPLFIGFRRTIYFFTEI